MKNYLILATFTSALLVSGCGQKESASAPAAASAAPAPATAGPRVIEITAGDNMKFNITSIEAKPGETLKIILTNIGQMPKEAMGHNIVILKKGVDTAAYAAAATTAKASEYLPPAFQDQVLAHSELIGPRKSSEFLLRSRPKPVTILSSVRSRPTIWSA